VVHHDLLEYRAVELDGTKWAGLVRLVGVSCWVRETY